MQTNLTQFKYMEYTIEIPPNTGSVSETKGLPDGFTTSNCMIVSCMHCIFYSTINKAFEDYYVLGSNKNISASLKNAYSDKVSINCDLEQNDFYKWVYFKILFYKFK